MIVLITHPKHIFNIIICILLSAFPFHNSLKTVFVECSCDIPELISRRHREPRSLIHSDPKTDVYTSPN